MPSSAEKPEGYQLSRVQSRLASNAGGSDILLIQTSLPWNSSANTQVLAELGYTYDVVDMRNIDGVDLFRYPVMLIVNDQVQAFYDQYAQQIAAFENYVSNGGLLVFFAASDGWAEGTLLAPLPGGVRLTTPAYENYNYVVNSNHPIVSRQLSEGISLSNGDLFSNYCSHGYFSGLPPGTNVILEESHGQPTLIEYPIGTGRVIASTQTWEHNWAYHIGDDGYGPFARKALDDLFLYAFSQSGVIDGLFNIVPSSVPADGVTPINVTLAGVEPGHQVRLLSSRGSIDVFEASRGFVDAQGRFSTKLHSSTPGEAVLSAQDLTAQQTLPTAVQVTFTAVHPGQPEPPPVREPGTIELLGVSADLELQGLFPIGIGKIENEIRTSVDWGGKTPGSIIYQFDNRAPIIQNAHGQYVKRTFDFGALLREGQNTLAITAEAQDGTRSEPRVFQMTGWTAESGWLQALLDSLVYMDEDKVEVIVRVPSYPLESEIIKSWIPGKRTTLGPQAVGQATIPLSDGRYEIGLGAGWVRDSSVPGAKPWYGRGMFSFVGNNDLEADFTGLAQGNFSSQPPYLSVPDSIKVMARGQVTFDISESVLIVIQPLAPVGTTIVGALKSVPPVYDWVKDRAKFYVEATPELGGDLTFKFQDRDLIPDSTALYARVDLEGGMKIDIFVTEGKVYLGGGSQLEWGLVPQFGMERWVFYGIAGYKLKTGWFEQSTEGNFEWIAYEAGNQQIQTRLQEELQTTSNTDWQLIPRTYADDSYTIFNAVRKEGISQPFAIADVTQGTAADPLSTNVFPYPEPDLMMNERDQALLLWTHDDLSRATGQGYDLRYSFWNGSYWKTPASATDDAYPDGRAKIAWLNDETALAVWQRLDDSTLTPDATLDLAQTRKLELAWATYDVATDAWSQSHWLTRDSDANAQTPVLSRWADGDIWAAWRSNPHGLLSGNDNFPDQIMAAQWDNGGWNTPQVVVSQIPSVVDIALAHQGNQGILAWTAEALPTGSITPTLQLFISRFDGASWSPPRQLTDSPEEHTRPQLVYRQGQPYVAWLADDVLALQRIANLESQKYLSRQSATLLDDGEAVRLGSNIQVDQFRMLQDDAGNLFAVFTGQQGIQRAIFLTEYDVDAGA